MHHKIRVAGDGPVRLASFRCDAASGPEPQAAGSCGTPPSDANWMTLGRMMVRHAPNRVPRKYYLCEMRLYLSAGKPTHHTPVELQSGFSRNVQTVAYQAPPNQPP